ncbi:MAG: DUF11 domain-containing protein, partial [Anaerolineae bacterium]|nr:DUF11 domain-containing protein [Anaerolineae bacterium]
VQALLSAGQNPPGNWCARSSCSYLLNIQQTNGSFPGYSPLYATQEAIPALMQRPYGPLAHWTYHCNFCMVISKTVQTPGGVSEVPLGSVVTYTVVLRNTGATPVANVEMKDVLPSGVVFSHWVQQGSALLLDGHTVTWGPYDIAGGEAYTISFAVNVPPGTLRPASQVVNTARFTDAYGGSGSASAVFVTEKYRIYLPLVMRNR